MRLLLVEDEKRLSEALSYILRKHSFGVDTAFDGETGQAMAETGVYDLIILDRMLPCKEGVAVLKELRKQGIEVPVLLLTAMDSVQDKVQGLDAGADDYLVKPFATDEFLARIRALVRRQGNKLQGEKLSCAGLILDPLSCEVVSGHETIRLTLKETQLLELFLRNLGQVITKEQILNRVWGLESEVEINNVETYIHYLRKKIQYTSVRIKTVRGIGYLIREDSNVSQVKT